MAPGSQAFQKREMTSFRAKGLFHNALRSTDPKTQSQTSSPKPETTHPSVGVLEHRGETLSRRFSPTYMVQNSVPHLRILWGWISHPQTTAGVSEYGVEEYPGGKLLSHCASDRQPLNPTQNIQPQAILTLAGVPAHTDEAMNRKFSPTHSSSNHSRRSRIRR